VKDPDDMTDIVTLWRGERAAGHGRDKVVHFATADCDTCGRREHCLGFDSSENEYGPVWICQTCTTRLEGAFFEQPSRT
jgi:hypothetical protein